MRIDEARARSDAFVFVYCDDASHGRVVAVTNFARIRGDWVEVPASRAAASGYVGTGRHIVADELPAPGWALEEEHGTVRDRHELVCRKCKRRPLPVTAEKLHPALDRMAAANVSRVNLSGLAAILRGMARPE